MCLGLCHWYSEVTGPPTNQPLLYNLNGQDDITDRFPANLKFMLIINDRLRIIPNMYTLCGFCISPFLAGTPAFRALSLPTFCVKPPSNAKTIEYHGNLDRDMSWYVHYISVIMPISWSNTLIEK